MASSSTKEQLAATQGVRGIEPPVMEIYGWKKLGKFLH